MWMEGGLSFYLQDELQDELLRSNSAQSSCWSSLVPTGGESSWFDTDSDSVVNVKPPLNVPHPCLYEEQYSPKFLHTENTMKRGLWSICCFGKC